MNLRRTDLASIFALIFLAIATQTASAGGDWNDENIGWRPYAEGLAAAKAEEKPICLIFFTEWCPHCKNYSKVFHDPKVVERSQNFVMIRIDKDKNAKISDQYAPDGTYIPRTYFLSSQGELDVKIHAPRTQYQFFYSETDPASVLAGMDAALKNFH